MGMAASQARFLGLTARKSNVEYQGQQVNQERTALANESSGLFNQMLALEVPTPPSTSDFYKYNYSFTGSATNIDGTSNSTTYTVDSYEAGDNSTTSQPTYNVTLHYTTKGSPIKGSTSSITTKINKSTDVSGNVSYTIPATSSTASSGDVYTLNKTTDPTNSSKSAYYYSDGTKTYYISDENTITDGGTTYSTLSAYLNSLSDGQTATALSLSQFTTQDTSVYNTSTWKNVAMATNSSGQFVSIQPLDSSVIVNSDGTTSSLEDADIISDTSNTSLTYAQETDEAGYNEAMNTYNYKKALYDKEVSDINAKTSTIQTQDRTLELQLKQLDTEEKALENELEAVKKVIENNVKATFKTFA